MFKRTVLSAAAVFAIIGAVGLVLSDIARPGRRELARLRSVRYDPLARYSMLVPGMKPNDVAFWVGWPQRVTVNRDWERTSAKADITHRTRYIWTYPDHVELDFDERHIFLAPTMAPSYWVITGHTRRSSDTLVPAKQ